MPSIRESGYQNGQTIYRTQPPYVIVDSLQKSSQIITFPSATFYLAHAMINRVNTADWQILAYLIVKNVVALEDNTIYELV